MRRSRIGRDAEVGTLRALSGRFARRLEYNFSARQLQRLKYGETLCTGGERYPLMEKLRPADRIFCRERGGKNPGARRGLSGRASRSPARLAARETLLDARRGLPCRR